MDNSFDASAKRIDLHWPGGNVFRIEDDGIGCDDLMRMVTLGQRREYDATSVGKYAVGAKLAMIWLWGRTHIESCCQGNATQVTLDWDDIANEVVEFPTCAIPIDSQL